MPYMLLMYSAERVECLGKEICSMGIRAEQMQEHFPLTKANSKVPLGLQEATQPLFPSSGTEFVQDVESH